MKKNKLIILIVCSFFPALLLTSCVEDMAKSEMKRVENHVAEDAVQQYEIAKRQGDKIQIYTQASMVAAAYLQANDEENYRKWKQIEKEAAKEAGITISELPTQ